MTSITSPVHVLQGEGLGYFLGGCGCLGGWQAFAFVFPGFIGSWHFVSFAGKLVFLLLPFQNRDFENSIPSTLLTCK